MTEIRETELKQLNYLEIVEEFLGVWERNKDSVISSGQIIKVFFSPLAL